MSGLRKIISVSMITYSEPQIQPTIEQRITAHLEDTKHRNTIEVIQRASITKAKASTIAIQLSVLKSIVKASINMVKNVTKVNTPAMNTSLPSKKQVAHARAEEKNIVNKVNIIRL